MATIPPFKQSTLEALSEIIGGTETGLTNTQIHRHGRNAISWDEKFKLDVWYVDHCTFTTDVKIVWLTIRKVLVRKDISSATSATMEEFDGGN